jgi:hypothetical protein
MNAKHGLWRRRAVLTALFPAFFAFAGLASAGEGPLEGEWGGLDARGATAQVIVTSGKILGFFWGGDYRDTGPSRVSERGGRIDFTFATGSASLLKTPAGARLTIKEAGRAPNSIELKKD